MNHSTPCKFELRAESSFSDLAFEASPISMIEAASDDGESGDIKSFEMIAYTGGAMQAGFMEPVVVDLGGVTLLKANPPILRDHDRSKVVGHAEVVEISSNRIKVRGLLSGANDQTREIVESSTNGFPWSASIAGLYVSTEYVAPGASVRVNGRNFNGPIEVVRKLVLTEISIVAIPADGKAKTKVAASASTQQEAADMKFSAWLKSKNLIEADLGEGELKTLRAEFDAGIADGTIKAEAPSDPAPAPAPAPTPAPTHTPSNPGPGAPPVNALEAQLAEGRQLQAAEVRRVAKIHELAASFPTIKASAIEENWSIEKVELEVLRASRPSNVPNGISRSGEQPTGIVLEAAICQAAKLGGIEDHFDDQTLQAAHTAYRGQIGLQEVLLLAAHEHNFIGRSVRLDLRGTLEAAFNLQASFSTLSLPGILSNVANKFLLQGFMTVEQAWREIAATRSVTDFKQVTSYRLAGGDAYQEVGPGGELKHTSLGEQSFNNQAKTYGQILGITREHIINDDLGALTAAPKMIGRNGAIKLNKVFWAIFLDNATFFAAGNGNYASGAGTALGVDAYSQAEQMFFDQTDPDGNPVAVDAAVLLVPNGLNVTAQQLMSSTEMRDTTASRKSLTKNPHAGKAKVVRSVYLSNALLSGYSALAWYLLANPLDLPVIEVAFLNGNQNPTVESAQADFNTLGIQMRGYHDFGIALQEHRGGVKMKGEA